MLPVPILHLSGDKDKMTEVFMNLENTLQIESWFNTLRNYFTNDHNVLNGLCPYESIENNWR